ncbi:uncharacterized protein CLUP02_03051 [Colletotrichum lupini]|uniref:Uncharacterized protein n=1 Tax=Colletotrichum lupini TaxID=145971 RepID=A0A9Q8SJD9_9PEZI|nr:uncharacterized protein CLUP02_03051 [Colletotrichum lupini]UQC77582.1 hypothetical protein CLUP02_03051 [Colletotrichum lupini]
MSLPMQHTLSGFSPHNSASKPPLYCPFQSPKPLAVGVNRLKKIRCGIQSVLRGVWSLLRCLFIMLAGKLYTPPGTL